jgi:hypothetical protein
MGKQQVLDGVNALCMRHESKMTEAYAAGQCIVNDLGPGRRARLCAEAAGCGPFRRLASLGESHG